MSLLKLIGVPGYRDGSEPPPEYIHINFYDGGLGDHVARLVAIKYLVEQYPQVQFTVWCPKFFLEFGKKAIPEIGWQEYAPHKTIKMSRYPLNAGSINGVTSLRTHLVDHAFMRLVDKQVDIKYKNYLQVDGSDVNLSSFNLPEKYVVITTGYTAAVREFNPKIVNAVSDFVIQKSYTPVFLGSKEATVGEGVPSIKGEFSKEIDFTKGIDLRDRTTLVQAHAIISKAKTIVGLDNGLLHVAGCTEIPIVAGFTTVDPDLRVPYRHDQLGWNVYAVSPPPSLKCRFCQSNMNFVFEFDFRKCFYKDVACVKLATPDPYLEHLEKIL